MTFELCLLHDDQLDEAIDVWVRARWDAEPWIEERMAYTPDQNASFFGDVIRARNDIWVALEGRSVIGVMALGNGEVDQLFIAPERQRQGVGTRLIEKAKALNPSRLRLHAHQRNERARRFYEKQGFVAIEFGVSPEPECEPDVHYEWCASARPELSG